MGSEETLLVLGAPPQVVQLGIGRHRPRNADTYRFGDTWCLHLYRYDARIVLNGEAFVVHRGSISCIRPATTIRFHYAEDPSVHLYALFRPQPSGEPRVALPTILEVGSRFEWLWDRLEDAVGFQATGTTRVSARLWDVLLELADATGSGDAPTINPLVPRAREWIERNIGGSIDAAAAAGAVGVSHNHLNRLFHSHLHQTVARYIRARRVETLTRLMRDTDMPIKVIAAEVGIPDLGRFNRFVHRECGRSPRALRRRLRDRMQRGR